MNGLDGVWHKVGAWWPGEQPSPPPRPPPHALLPRVSVLSAFPGRVCVPAWMRLPTCPGGTRVADYTALRGLLHSIPLQKRVSFYSRFNTSLTFAMSVPHVTCGLVSKARVRMT